jgi:hypothetical protein
LAGACTGSRTHTGIVVPIEWSEQTIDPRTDRAHGTRAARGISDPYRGSAWERTWRDRPITGWWGGTQRTDSAGCHFLNFQMPGGRSHLRARAAEPARSIRSLGSTRFITTLPASAPPFFLTTSRYLQGGCEVREKSKAL